MEYAILVHKKHHTMSALSAVAAHNNRTSAAPNADPRRASLNRQLHGTADLVAAVRAALDVAGITRLRRNGVLGVEMVLSASPGYFRPDAPHEIGTWRGARLGEWVTATMRYLRKTYGENLLSAVLHLDEGTPHIHALVLPVDRSPRRKGAATRLNASRWFGTPAKLRALQDAYHAELAPLGLRRGERGSAATHTEIRDWYMAMAATKAAAQAEQAALAAASRRAGFALIDAMEHEQAANDLRRQAEADAAQASEEREAAAAARAAAERDAREAAKGLAAAEADRAAAAEQCQRVEEETAAERKRVKSWAQAIDVGVGAWTEGAIVGAEESPRRLVWAPDVPAERRRQIEDAINPAFDAVWTLVGRLAAKLGEAMKAARDAAAEIVRRAEEEAGELHAGLAKRAQTIERRELQVDADLAAVDLSRAELEDALSRVRALKLPTERAQDFQHAEEMGRAAAVRVAPVRARVEWRMEGQRDR
ncbi:MobV family relaxase [Azospirillum sp. TSO22-1]|uniref:MobV family relaxase n=1 Tax=Azospirillum sp. TSO22-1 TaxID=716789 RepID=UPI001304F216|nr:MobV family relaxase [Azospirillum sp. TSO22-1]